ncbi:MAG: hypothetical protein OXI43_12440 [Candidatus Poribacteria bacterium]|nr:hypothetical protein [Candidatus Poribacteria bacterium]
MKIRLGSKEISLSRVHRVRKFSHHIAEIQFITSESIYVLCGVRVPDQVSFTYDGTVEELKALIEKLK